MTDTKSVVLIGGGHTHALVLNALKTAPFDGAHVTVINPGPTAPYSGMLPGFVAGHYDRAELDIDLAALTQKVGATLIDGRAIAMDPDGKTITLEDGTIVPYDVASVDVGITSHMHRLDGFADHGVPAKPLGVFADKWDAFRATTGAKSIVVIGGGIAGAELAMAMAYSAGQGATVRLLDRSTILSANSANARKRVRKALTANGVEIIEQADVTEVTKDRVVLADGTTIAAGFVVGVAGATPHGWLVDTGLTLVDGFITVDATLRTSAKQVFAVGDCAHMTAAPRPKAGVYAVRQAPVLTENMRATLTSAPLAPYHPQSDYLKLVSLGGKRAFGEKRGLWAAGHLVWRLKDRIDRAFMTQF